MRKLTNEGFKEKAMAIHGDFYDYSEIDYQGANSTITIICPKHGPFQQKARKHLEGQRCPKCGKEVWIEKRGRDTEKFIKESRVIHGDKYDYSKVNYTTDREKVCIICPEHGEFWQTPASHIHQKGGCPVCANIIRTQKRTKPQEKFIEDAITVHGDKYDYSKVEYVNTREKVCIICPIHGEFWQSPMKHLSGQGCPKCGLLTIGQKKRFDTEEFVKRATEAHGNKYDYSHAVYQLRHIPVKIICPEHGEFWQRPEVHVVSQGCPACTQIATAQKMLRDHESVIKQCKTVHGDKYDYSRSEYKGMLVDMLITCPEHGDFWQRPGNHIYSAFGCPTCGTQKAVLSRRGTVEEFIEKAEAVHKGLYAYDNVDFQGMGVPVSITCPVHGDFLQKPTAHLSGRGCRKCKNSIGELAVGEILDNLGMSYDSGFFLSDIVTEKGSPYNRGAIFDFVLYGDEEGDQIVGFIEFDGAQHFRPQAYFHSKGSDTSLFDAAQARDRAKDRYCKKYAIPLLRIPYTYVNPDKSYLYNSGDKIYNTIEDFCRWCLIKGEPPETYKQAWKDTENLLGLSK